MQIVTDNAIPHAVEAFGSLGDVITLPGTAIDRDTIADADVVVVRSVTRIDAALVAGTRLGMVGSATIGCDHVDQAYLAGAGIRFAHAAGCNADAVAQYVLAAVVDGSLRLGWPDLERRRTGVVGFGNIGRRLTRHLRSLGWPVAVCDPPLAEAVERGQYAADDEGADGELSRMPLAEPFVSIDELIADCDVLTLHVPLHGGDHATHHLLDAARLERLLARRTLLLNTSRGPIVDNRALTDLAGRAGDATGRVVLDVWEDEPNLHWPLVDQIGGLLLHGTPHIAGYTLEGKVNATRIMHQAVAEFAGVRPTWTGRDHLGQPGEERLEVAWPTAPGDSADAAFSRCLQAVRRLAADTQSVQALTRMPPERRATGFEALRKGYELRRQFAHYRVADAPLATPELHDRLRAVGFAVGAS